MWESLQVWLTSSVTVPVWALVAAFVAGLVIPVVLKAIAAEMEVNRKLRNLDHELDQDHSKGW